MIDFYNAFISYRHAELDSKVAEHVQRSLEHFHVPHAIRKKTGKNKIERIFRDKDELPITSDLTDTISNALEKADYLIVICSPNTCESIWVQREINFFLKNHDKSKILTVLADGEPNDVIPEILKTDERVIRDADGTERTIKVNIEPLSCDYRMPLNKAKKEEIPRLVAAVLGCSYDELVRRQRSYKTRRLMIVSAIVAAAAITFGVYMTVAKRRSDALLRESLYNQSRFLANEAELLLDQQRRIDGLYVALAAVPQSADDPRPLTGEAMHALSNATLAYVGQNESNVESLWSYGVSGTVEDMVIDEEGHRLAAIDNLNIISVWDTDTHEKLYDIINPDININYMGFIDDKLYVLAQVRLAAYDAATGELLWENTDEDDAFDYMLYEASLLEDYAPGQILVMTSVPSVRILDSNTGETLQEILLDDYRVGDYPISVSYFELSPDKTRLGMCIYEGMDENYIGMLDLQTGSFSISEDSCRFICDIVWFDDDHFAAASYNLSDFESAMVDDTYIISPNVSQLVCYDPDNLNELWSVEHVSTGMAYYRSFFPLPSENMLAFYSGDTCTAYDIDDGTVLYNWSVNESIINVSDRDGDANPLIITAGGAMAFPVKSQGNDMVTLTYEFADGIERAIVNHGVYAYQTNSREIIYYNAGAYDEEWEQTEGVTTTSVSSSYLDDDLLALVYGNDDGIILTMIDPNTNELIRDVTLGDDSDFSSQYDILGVYDGKLYIARTEYGASLYIVDLDDGDVDTEELVSDMVLYGERINMHGQFIVYQFTRDALPYVAYYDIEEGDSHEFEIPCDLVADLVYKPLYFESMGFMYAATTEGDYIVRTETDEIMRVDLPDDWNGTVCASADEQSERIFVSDGRQIMFFDINGDLEFTISTDSRRPLGFDILRPDEGDPIFIVLYADGELYRYNANDGSFIGSSEVETYINYISEVEFVSDWENGYLYIEMNGLTDVVNLADWVEEATIQNSFGHHAPTDSFYTTAYSISSVRSVGFFRHYSLQDLLDKAYEILGGNMEMPDYLLRYLGMGAST